ncbi:MAG: hypothetical protein IPJ65_08415 [Archangiaceae bacterium]|nr:hypothetical protein [Archangiaceae bacterium]
MPLRPSKDDQALLARARAAWPALPLEAAAFLAWLGQRAPQGEAHVEALWLVRACELNLRGALAAFERDALKPALLRLPAHDRADVGQRVLQRLFTGPDPKIRQYRGRGALVRWLQVIALREGRGERRAARREDVRDDLPALAGAISPHELLGPPSDVKRRANAALTEALTALTDAERTLLRRHFLEGATHAVLGEELGIPRSTVAYRLTRLTQRVLESMRARLEDSGLSASQLEQLVSQLRSKVDLSFSILRRA